MRVRDLSLAELAAQLQSPHGLKLKLGPYCASIGTPLQHVQRSFASLYRDHALAADGDFIDFRVEVRRPAGLRALLNPQARFLVDGRSHFNPLPVNQGYPLLEWGLNYCVYAQFHHHLTLHAAVLERNGKALILPAPSGSGKSTLCAGLSFRGWRLLSDELTLICLEQGNIIPLPRPVSLKNQSIAVIKAFAPEVEFGSEVSETVKGVVAHFRPSRESVEACDRRAEPGWIVLPKFVVGSPARLQRLDKARALINLVANAFNYDMQGAKGFAALTAAVSKSECYTFEYSDLEEAASVFEQVAIGAWPASLPGTGA